MTMSFIKKNQLFCIVVAVCVLAFLAGAFLAFKGSGNVNKAQRSLTAAEAKLNNLLSSSPSPTEENLIVAERNLAELQAALAEIREDLQPGAALKTSDDGVSVIAGIQQYISRFQKAAAANKNESDQAAPIGTPNDFAFGFEQYLKVATPPDDSAKASLLDKQRQILSYLLTQLILAGPHSIDAVEREILESSDRGGFSIDEAISARVPGAINTMAYSLTFSGYTSSLRDLLNNLARFELPIVVRSVAVKRPSGSETVIARAGSNSQDAITALFGGGDFSAGDKKAEWPKAVIEENISQFTVILEFIEVVLPDTQNPEVSDPA